MCHCLKKIINCGPLHVSQRVALWSYGKSIKVISPALKTPSKLWNLLTSLIPWRTFNIHGNFPLHKRCFIMKKNSFIRLLKCSSKKTMVLLRTVQILFWGTQDGSSMAAKPPYGTFILKSVGLYKKFRSLCSFLSSLYKGALFTM